MHDKEIRQKHSIRAIHINFMSIGKQLGSPYGEIIGVYLEELRSILLGPHTLGNTCIFVNKNTRAYNANKLPPFNFYFSK